MEYNIIIIYKACLIFGMGFSVLTLFFGDFLDDALDGIFDAAFSGDDIGIVSLLVTFISIFGGVGLLFEYLTSFDYIFIFWTTLFIALILTNLFYFLYLKPMKKNENSVAFFIDELKGKEGEVIASIFEYKFGEVVIKFGTGYVNKVAASTCNEDISVGTNVFVDYVKDGILYVSKIDSTEFK